MLVTTHKEPFHHIIIEDFYSNEELEWVWKELELLSRPGVFQLPEATNSALKDYELLKDNVGVFLDRVYQNCRELSCILEYNLKIFDSEILNPEDLWFFSHFEPKKFYTLLSYYEDKHYYKTHHDDCTVSSLTWLYKEPKKFSGGELTFTDFGYTVECKCNNTILFPSQIRHSVSEVSIDPEHRGKGFGRYCISQFIHPISW